MRGETYAYADFFVYYKPFFFHVKVTAHRVGLACTCRPFSRMDSSRAVLDKGVTTNGQ